MNEDYTSRLEELFRRALELPREERSDFLDASCGDEPVLKNELEELLRADDEAEKASFLERGAGEWLPRLFDDFQLPSSRRREIVPWLPIHSSPSMGVSTRAPAVNSSDLLHREPSQRNSFSSAAAHARSSPSAATA